MREEDKFAAQAGIDWSLPLVVAVAGIGDWLAAPVANNDRPHALWRHLDLQRHTEPPERTSVRIRRLYQM